MQYSVRLHCFCFFLCDQSYGRPSELGQEIQVFVQSVSPGSPAFMSGLFPGDTILEVNGVNVRSDPVATVVKRIQDCPRTSDKKWECYTTIRLSLNVIVGIVVCATIGTVLAILIFCLSVCMHTVLAVANEQYVETRGIGLQSSAWSLIILSYFIGL